MVLKIFAQTGTLEKESPGAASFFAEIMFKIIQDGSWRKPTSDEGLFVLGLTGRSPKLLVLVVPVALETKS